MKQSILIILILYFSNFAVCQNNYNVESSIKNKRKINALGEIGGNGIVLSLGLEHALYNHKVLKNTIRWGISITEYSAFGEYNINFGKNNNYFELGAGPTLNYNEGFNLLVFGRIGYRYNSDRFIFRIGFTPYFITDLGSNAIVRPYFGISFGVPIK